jgi:cellulose biosynthesis protein BcsQ
MKIAVIGDKGGTGKSTCCLLLHEAFKQANITAAVRDLDNIQSSITKALERIGGARAVDGKVYDVLIIDTSPSLLSPGTASAIVQADVVLVPTGPSPFEVWQAQSAVAFARRKNPSAKVVILLNRVRAGTLLTAAIRDNLTGVDAPILNAQLTERQSYQHAILGGWAAMDAKAKEEAMALCEAVRAVVK